MKILVTGGAGFIGSAVIKNLQEHENEIFVIDNLSFGNRDFISVDDDHFFKVDILDEQAVAKIIDAVQPEQIVHLAAIHFIPYCNEHPFESANINIQGTANVLKAAGNTASVKLLLFASTAAVYPISDIAVGEHHQLKPLDIYGLSKLAGEHLCNEFHLRTGKPVVICRFFNAFGPNETNPHLIPEIERQIKTGAASIALGNMEPKRDFIHTSDMAEAVRLLLAKFRKGIDVFNLGRGIEYSVTEVVASFEKAAGRKVDVQTDPARVRKTERMHLLADISRIKEFTGWKPQVSLDEGIRTLMSK